MMWPRPGGLWTRAKATSQPCCPPGLPSWLHPQPRVADDEEQVGKGEGESGLGKKASTCCGSTEKRWHSPSPQETENQGSQWRVWGGGTEMGEGQLYKGFCFSSLHRVDRLVRCACLSLPS